MISIDWCDIFFPHSVLPGGALSVARLLHKKEEFPELLHRAQHHRWGRVVAGAKNIDKLSNVSGASI